MADANSTVPPITIDFPSKGSNLFALASGATSSEVESLLEVKIAHLDALLSVTYGGCGLRSFNDDIQDRFMFACSMLSTEVMALHQAIYELKAREESH